MLFNCFRCFLSFLFYVYSEYNAQQKSLSFHNITFNYATKMMMYLAVKEYALHKWNEYLVKWWIIWLFPEQYLSIQRNLYLTISAPEQEEWNACPFSGGYDFAMYTYKDKYVSSIFFTTMYMIDTIDIILITKRTIIYIHYVNSLSWAGIILKSWAWN